MLRQVQEEDVIEVAQTAGEMESDDMVSSVAQRKRARVGERESVRIQQSQDTETQEMQL